MAAAAYARRQRKKPKSRKRPPVIAAATLGALITSGLAAGRRAHLGVTRTLPRRKKTPAVRVVLVGRGLRSARGSRHHRDGSTGVL